MLPIVYFNTKILFLDDEKHFFDGLKLYLADSPFHIAHFLNSADLLKYLHQQDYSLDLNKLLQITDHQDHGYEYNIQAKDIFNIHKFATNEQKSQIISTIVIDYNLKGETGLEVAALLRKMGFSIVLLTNHNDISTAISAFNAGLIDFYIQKYAANLAHTLQETLFKAQHKYFERQSIIYYQIIKSLNPNNVLLSVEFENHFDNLVQDYNITEFYLLDTVGSFVFLSTDQRKNIAMETNSNINCYKFNILHVSQDVGNQLLLEIAEIEGAPDQLIATIIDKHNLLCYYNKDNYMLPDIKDWPKYFQPATLINFDGKNYKYAVTTIL